MTRLLVENGPPLYAIKKIIRSVRLAVKDIADDNEKWLETEMYSSWLQGYQPVLTAVKVRPFFPQDGTALVVVSTTIECPQRYSERFSSARSRAWLDMLYHPISLD